VPRSYVTLAEHVRLIRSGGLPQDRGEPGHGAVRRLIIPTGSDNEKSLCQREAMAEAMKVPMQPLEENPRGALIRPEVREPFNITKDRGGAAKARP
jgi:hypothetical protein